MPVYKSASKEKELRGFDRWPIFVVYLALVGLTLAMSAVLTFIQTRY